MAKQVLIAGGGIGGMSAALACARAGWGVQLFERAPAFSEVGAGIQLGPNVTRQLNAWGLASAVAEVAALPDQLQVRDADSGQTLGLLRLGQQTQARYGAPYVTIHRADLHRLLHTATQQEGAVQIQLNTALRQFSEDLNSVKAQLTSEASTFSAGAVEVEGDALVGADGLWSPVRQILLQDGQPMVAGHLAYRALVRQAALPEALRTQNITVWLGSRLHVVQYPVRGGDWLNVVAIVQARLPGPVQNLGPERLDHWDHSANAIELQRVLADTCGPLQNLVHAVGHWRLWVLCDRPPMRGPQEQALGRVALLGDAAHPMRPYLAQGAGMAIEDAAALGQALGQALTPSANVPAALRRYAQERWQRNARVQARAERNGRIFHATGPIRWSRNLAMRLGGERLLDMPWLYGANTTA
ncbi:FAD-dependent monooxygenase [Variovorax sp. HJSM1_2]|uniref:FAD-dependent monooxygenase n=1 Tax=Variovorax sp. HJSM1_2 TaxID=3366263 RepID=UPI003BDFFE69